MHNGMTLTHIQGQGHRDPNALAEVDRQSPYGANFVALCILVIVVREFDVEVECASYILQTVLDRGMARSCDSLTNFRGFNYITGMAEPKVVDYFYTGRLYQL